MKVFKNQAVSELHRFYGPLLDPAPGATLQQYLEQQALRLFEGIQQKDPVVLIEISNYDPLHLGRKKEDIPMNVLSRETAYRTIACEYGFSGWEEVNEKGRDMLDLSFENAVNLLLAGDLHQLKKVIEENPGLLKQTSQFGHQATLLHYTGSNGVEAWRQVVPMNLTDVVKYLLEMGADKEARMKVYGGAYNTLALLSSSGHPFEAGIGEELVALLQ